MNNELPTVSTASPPRANLAEMVVRVCGVSRYFDPGYVRVVTNVNFEVHGGEVFGLLGPSGSGKSAVARILAGRLTPSEGKVKVFGRSPRRRTVRARISYLPQKPSHDCSQFLVRVIGFFTDLVQGVNSRASRRHSSYRPRGEERIAATKRIVVQKTRLVLLDEPFLDLDAGDRREMKDLIRIIAQQGRTVIVCSRSLNDAKAVCSRVAVLSRGEIQALGTVEELLASRANLRLVVDLLPDETATNLLRAIRQELGVSDLESTLSSGTQTKRSKADETPKQGIPQPAESAAAALLRSLSKRAPSGCSQVPEPALSVNHELLAALTKPIDEKSDRGASHEAQLPRAADGCGWIKTQRQ